MNRQGPETEELLRLIIENARDYAIFSMDLDRKITSWNSGAERILRFSHDEAIGQTGDMIFTPEDRAKGAPIQEAETALRECRAMDERWHLKKGGERFWSSGVMAPLLGPGGKPIGLVKILRDRTEAKLHDEALAESRRELEAALKATQRAREEAEAANRVKDRFMATLSHELRTPLTPVLMAAESLLKRKDLPPLAIEGLQMICQNIELETRLIDELLDLTRISRGKFELKRAPVSANETIERALKLCRDDIDAKKQKLTLNLAANPDELVGDSDRLQQVFWNLVKNASKFTPERGEIKIATRNDRDTLVIEVTDDGRGIPADALENIFEPFQQASPTITREFGGLGLGLAIAKGIVDAHGGEISASSNGANQGAMFTVRLPVFGRS